MKLPLIRQALAISLCTLFVQPLAAESQLLSEFKMEMNKKISYGDNPLLSDSYYGNKIIPMRNFPLESKFPTWLENIKVDLDYKMSPLLPWNFAKAQDVNSLHLNAVVHIGVIRTEFTETRMSGDTPITIDFKAQCHNVQLTLKDPRTTFTANITPQNLGHKIQLVLNKSDIQWAQGAWAVADFNCTGVQGFKDIAKTEIIRSLQNSNAIQNQIFKELQRQVTDWEESINKTIFNTHVVDENLANFYSYLNPTQLIKETQDNDFHFTGHFHFRSQNIALKKSIQKTVPFKSPPTSSTVDADAVLTMPIETLASLLEEMLKNGNLFSKFTSDQVDGFQDLMQSTTKRERVWPDLLNYSTKDQFKFEMQLIEKPVITEVRNDKGGLIVRSNSKLALHMFAPRDGQYWPYVEWTAPFTMETRIQIKNGKITSQLGNIHRFTWKHRMIPAYIEKFRPKSTKIDMATIEEALISDLKTKNFNSTMPDWRLSKKLHYRANGLYNEGPYIRIYWYTVSNNL